VRDLDRVIALIYSGKTKDARKAYLEEYGFQHDDLKVERKLEELFDDALGFDPPDTKADVPLHLLLAILLRRQKQGTPRKILPREGRKRALLLLKLRKKKGQRRPGESATQALRRVAKVGTRVFKMVFGEKRRIETMKRWLEAKPRPRR
jgi:hypothetical protein